MDEQTVQRPADRRRRRWVQDVLPLASSLAVHGAVVAAAVVLVGTVVRSSTSSPNHDQQVVPTMEVTPTHKPGGADRPAGPPVDPTRAAGQQDFKVDQAAGYDSTPTAGAATPQFGTAGGAHRGPSFVHGTGNAARFGPPGGDRGVSFEGIHDRGGDGPTNATSVVFLCDASGSMVGVFGQLKQELKRSVSGLAVDEYGAQRFNVIFFNEGRPTALFADGMHVASPEAKRAADRFIDDAVSAGGTEPTAAVGLALAEHPDVVFVLTDGFDQVADLGTVVEQFRRGTADGRTHVNCIFLQSDEDPKLVAALRRIAADGHGQFKAILKKDM